MKLTCPHCSLQAMSAWRKLALGPAVRRPCRACGLRVGVEPVRAYAAFLPCFALIAGVNSLPVSLMLPAAGAALVATFALYLTWVPLAKRQITDPDAVREATARAGALPRAG